MPVARRTFLAALTAASSLAPSGIRADAIAAAHLPLTRYFNHLPPQTSIVERRCYTNNPAALKTLLPESWSESPNEILLAFRDLAHRTQFWDNLGILPAASAQAIEIYRVG
jgi:hypothetical protein